MAVMPQPAPPLDGVPPSPPSVSAGGGPNPQISQLSPGVQMGGTMQVAQACLQAAAEAAKLIDLIGQINPGFAPVSAQLIEMLRNGLKSALQQGSSGSEPTAPNIPSMAMPSATPTPGASQAPLPPMGSGMQ